LISWKKEDANYALWVPSSTLLTVSALEEEEEEEEEEEVELGVLLKSTTVFCLLKTWDSREGVLGFKSFCCCFCIFLKVNQRPPLNPNPYLPFPPIRNKGCEKKKFTDPKSTLN